MKRTAGFICLVALMSLGAACGADSNANNNNTGPRNGVIETNANVQNLNANNAPSNTGVLTNDNGNKNTSGIREINGNRNHNRP